MFEITQSNVSLVHKNDRLEKHGDEDVLACDLNFQWETDNGALAMFAPDLRSLLYKKQDSQGELINDPSHLTALRFPALAPLKWVAGDLHGAKLLFHVGVSDKSNVLLEDVRVGKYRIEAKEGGTVVISFQAQCKPDEKQSGKLSRFLSDKLCTITLEPPPAPADLTEGGRGSD